MRCPVCDYIWYESMYECPRCLQPGAARFAQVAWHHRENGDRRLALGFIRQARNIDRRIARKYYRIGLRLTVKF